MKKRLFEISFMLLIVWSFMILILVIIELIIAPIESHSSLYSYILLVQIGKLAATGILVCIWLFSWYRLTCKYFWTRVDADENMA
ncbi:MAG: hypothetical protein ACXAC2_13075 [Candidatus Kariarchaeaceae archaeon]|jgi:hypothetical protein